jgi:AAA+ ATPase superfamily predicted ATPase
MMLGLLLDARAPLYGRAQEILKIEPLPAPELKKALTLRSDLLLIEHYSVWGGVPRYWELAADFPSLKQAVMELVLDPMGVLHMEPERLLMDDIRDIAQTSSILSLIGAGCQRLSEIAGRLGHPATSLSRPLARLIDMGLVQREVPFGSALNDSKKSFYRIRDPFLAFFYRFVAPNRSRLGAGQGEAVAQEIDSQLAQHTGLIWEDGVRSALPHMSIGGVSYAPGARWWGNGLDGRPLEIDVVAAAPREGRYLAVEVKRSISARDAERLLDELRQKVMRCPLLSGKPVTLALYAIQASGVRGNSNVFTARDVLAALEQ